MRHTANHAPLLLPAASLALGIAAERWMEGSVLAWMAALAAAVVAALLCLRREKAGSLLILTAVFLLGALLSRQAENRLIGTLPKQKVAYEAILMSEPVQRGKVVRFDLAILTEGKTIMTQAALLRDTLTGRYERLHVGDGIRAASYLEKPTNFHLSHFDYARWLRLHGFSAETFILPCDWQKARVSLSPLGHWNRAVLKARKAKQAILQRYQQLRIGGEELALVAAMSLGDKSLLTQATKEDYSRAGTSHLLALSGLHLSILYSLLALIGGRKARRKWLPTLLIITGVWAFAFLTGLSPSIVRAALMLSLYAMVSLLGRDRQPINALMATVIIMLVVKPLIIYDIAFQLSVLAVWSILLFHPLLAPPIPSGKGGLAHRCAHALWSFAILSTAAQLGTAPLIAYTFGSLPSYFLLANLLAVPCATLLLHLVVLLLLTSPLPVAQTLVAQAIAWTAKLMGEAMGWVASLPGASIENLHPTLLQTALCYCLIVILWCLALWIQRVRKQGKDVYED